MSNPREYRSISESKRLKIPREDRRSFLTHVSSQMYDCIKEAAKANQTSMAFFVNRVLDEHLSELGSSINTPVEQSQASSVPEQQPK